MILAVDCGSTNLKAALYDSALNRLALHSVPVVYSRRDALHAEFEAERLWSAFLDLVGTLLHQAGCSPAAIKRVALGSQAQTFCLLDAKADELIPFISWMDVRAEAESAQLTLAFGHDFHRHCSFSSPVAAMEVSKLLWVREHLPAVWKEARHLVSVPGYLCLRLAGRNLMDVNLAAMHGYYSMSADGWRKDLLGFIGVPAAWLPEIAPAGHVWKGRLQVEGWPASQEIELVLAGNDHTAGAIGNGCRPGETIVTFGTALVAYRRTGAISGPYEPGGCWGPYPLGGYYELATSNHGCSALDWARQLLLPDAPVSEFDAVAATAELGSGGTFFHPEKSRTSGAWSGDGTPAERARAVLEGILFTLRSLLANDMKVGPLSSVCALGGGARSGFWMQMAADILGCLVRRGEGDGVLGAAALAAGRAKELELRLGEAWTPNPDCRVQYDVCYANWAKT